MQSLCVYEYSSDLKFQYLFDQITGINDKVTGINNNLNIGLLGIGSLFVVVVTFGVYFNVSMERMTAENRENRRIDREEMIADKAEMKAVTQANKMEARIMSFVPFMIAIAAIVIPFLTPRIAEQSDPSHQSIVDCLVICRH